MSISTAAHFRNAWRIFQQHAGVFVGGMLVLLASWVALEIAVILLDRFGFVVWLLLHLAWLFLFAGLMVGMHLLALKAVDGETPRIRFLFHSFNEGPAYVLALVVYSLGVICGLTLLIVPGIYLAVRYFLFAQIITAQSASAFRALHGSALLSAGQWPAVGGVFLGSLLLNLAGAALLGLGLLVSFPVSLLAISGLFRSLQRAAP